MILYAERNPGYDLLKQEAFRNAQVPLDVRLVSDCEELLQYLSKCGECRPENVPCPNVIVLNLRIFGQIGIAGLAYIKSNPFFWDVPTIVLTNSKAEADAVRSYRLRAVAYTRRPRTVSRLIRIMRAAQAVADDQAARQEKSDDCARCACQS